MALFTTSFFVTDSGRSPVLEFLESLDQRAQRKFLFVRGLLEEFGHRLSLPYVKYIGNDIYELRFVGSEGNIRMLYFFFLAQTIIFVHGFVKKTNKIPTRELLVAKERRMEYINSQSERGG